MEPEQFNQLPFDARVELMKHKPYFRRLNKSYYTQGKLAFEEKYCNIDISMKEIINYIRSDDVEEFAIFYINDEIITTDYYIKENGRHIVSRREMYYDNVDLGEYKLISDDVEFLDDIINILSENNVYMDVKSVNHIIAKRGCKNAKEYTIKYIDNMMMKKGSGDMNNLFMHYVKVFYLTTSYDVIVGDYMNDIYDLSYIDFNEMGNVFVDDEDKYEQELENSDKLITSYYDKIMKWLEQ
jgi:hypothetical protein